MATNPIRFRLYEPSEQDDIRRNIADYLPTAPLLRVSDGTNAICLLLKSHPTSDGPGMESLEYAFAAANAHEGLLGLLQECGGRLVESVEDPNSPPPEIVDLLDRVKTELAKHGDYTITNGNTLKVGATVR